MKWKKFLFFMPLFTLFGCTPSKELKTVCPLGAPSLLFYDQGNNSNFVTTSATATILAQFQRNEYDAIVIDSTSGLNAIQKYKDTTPFRFAKLLTNGNLYMVTHKQNDFNVTNTSTVCCFGSETSVPYLSLKAIYSNLLEKNITRLDGINQVLAKLNNNPDSFDYFVLAEPSLTKVKTPLNLKVNKFNLGSEIKIPQAALFINKNSYYNKKDKINNYISNLNKRIDVCINNPSEFKSSFDKYGDDSKVSQRFGFNSSIAYEVQKDLNNGFAIYPNIDKFTYTDMNNFMIAINQEAKYTKEEFIDVE